jgi:hypothetical protein
MEAFQKHSCTNLVHNRCPWLILFPEQKRIHLSKRTHMLSSYNFQIFFFLFNKFLSLLSWCLAACKLGLAFSHSFNSRFVVRQSTSNYGLWQCLSLQLPPKGLLPKVDFAITPMHCHSRLANPSGAKCLIESTTHRFPKLVVKASWYFLAFDLSHLNLGKNFFITTACCGSTKLQLMLNYRHNGNGLWSEFPPIV